MAVGCVCNWGVLCCTPQTTIWQEHMIMNHLISRCSRNVQTSHGIPMWRFPESGGYLQIIQVTRPSLDLLGVSWNGGTLKWMVYFEKSHEDRWFEGSPILGYFRKPPLMTVVVLKPTVTGPAQRQLSSQEEAIRAHDALNGKAIMGHLGRS